VTDSWTPGPAPSNGWTPGPPPAPAPPIAPELPLADQWNPEAGCLSSGCTLSVVGNIILNCAEGASISYAANGSLIWSLALNDGSDNVALQQWAGGELVSTPLEVSNTDGSVWFNTPVTLAADPTTAMGAATKDYVDNHSGGIPEAPMDNYTYARYMATWERLPQTYIPEAPNTGQRFGRFNSIWQLDAIQVDAPDSSNYVRQNGAWTAAAYLPLAGGTITGSLTVNQVMTVQGPNSLVLNAPLNNPRAILCSASNVMRWVLNLGDGTTEGLNNVGANFSLQAYSTTGPLLGTWLTIARADGSTTFNGSGVTINGGLAVNGLLALAGPANLAIFGGAAGQVLSTNGSGILYWANPGSGGGGGGIDDAPIDGTSYARKSAAWVHLTHSDITDWATSIPLASSTPPAMDGTAAPGVATTFSRGDHVHPTDTSRAAASALASYVPLAGGSMTGTLFLPYDPIVPLAAATKQYVDAHAGGIGEAPTDGQLYSRQSSAWTPTVVPLGDNRIINGDMRVDQRNNGAAGTATNVYTVDRWLYGTNVAGNILNWGRNYNGGSNTAQFLAAGFPYNLGFQVFQARTLAAADYFALYQPIEADMVGDLAWGTTNARPVTLSFWVLSNQTGTFSGSIRNYAGTRSYPFTFNISTVVVATRIVVNIPGDITGTWVVSGNAGALIVGFDLGAGVNWRGPAGAWTAGNLIGATGAVSLAATIGLIFSIGGVKLEVGNIATPFNRQSLARTFADCQRYYIRDALLGATSYALAGGTFWNSSMLPTTMRASPTMTVAGSSYTNCSTPAIAPESASSFYINALATVTGGATWYAAFTASAEL
jgi:hypothetical protein